MTENVPKLCRIKNKYTSLQKLFGSQLPSQLEQNNNKYYQSYTNIAFSQNCLPIHINKMRCENYFWHWSSSHKDWIRTEIIPEELKRAYKNPLIKSNYTTLYFKTNISLNT